MKAAWQQKPLGEVCTLQRGFDLPTQDRKAGKFPLVSSSGISDTHDEGPVLGPGVVTGRSGSIGNVFYIEDSFWPLNTTLYVRDFHGNLPRFVYYLLVAFDLKQYAGGAGVPTLNRNDVHGVPVVVPRELPEQQRIVTLLDEAFDGIATARANAEQNLQNARALFESHLQSVYSQGGDGWIERSLGAVCAITSTLVDPRKPEFLDLTHVGAGNIESKTGAFVELKTARQEGLISGKFLFDESMVLYSKIRPYLMKVARPDFSGLCSADMYPLTPLPGVANKDYLFHLLLSKHFTDYAIQGSARAGMPKVNREHLFEFRVSLPSVNKQREIASKLDELHEETQRLESIYQRKLAALDALKKSLLHQAFNGQL
jgi:type I restriction enzyme, S subunit